MVDPYIEKNAMQSVIVDCIKHEGQRNDRLAAIKHKLPSESVRGLFATMNLKEKYSKRGSRHLKGYNLHHYR